MKKNRLLSLFISRIILAVVINGNLANSETITKPESINFNQLREKQIQRIDSGVSLELLARSLGQTDHPGTQTALLKGILKGMEGRRNVTPPEGWLTARLHLLQSDSAGVRQMTERLSQIFGDKEAAAQALKNVLDRTLSIEQRRSALKSLVTQKSTELKKLLPALLDDPALRIDAIRAYSSLEDQDGARLLISRYPEMAIPARLATIETLATRKSYATILLDALESKQVTKGEIPAYIARNLSDLLGEKFTGTYGDINALSKDKVELMARYRKLLTSDRLKTANSGKGRQVFQSSCSACHVLYGTGGVIGPDLTGSNRADLDYILLNMIDPGADIPDAYKLVTVKTKSGQILVGTLFQEDDQRIVLNMVGQKITVLKRDLESRRVSALSMMPEGLLPTLKDEQVLDLVKYLQTSQQVALPE